ncbi:MAG: hypothetical protein KGN01_06660 [Patescibacteria group bacterium]|nr:hypothetical protein [Patescibacteria group bacterium]
MIRKMALAAWRKLPAEHRVVFSVLDLEQEGILALVIALRQRKYDYTRAKLSSYAYSILHNYFINRGQYAWKDKRRCEKQLSIDWNWDKKVSGAPSFENLLPIKDSHCKFSDVELFQVYRNIYWASSPPLKRYLASALGVPVLTAVPSHPLRERVPSFQIRKSLQAEFKVLCQKFGFTYSMAEFMSQGGASEYLVCLR